MICVITAFDDKVKGFNLVIGHCPCALRCAITARARERNWLNTWKTAMMQQQEERLQPYSAEHYAWLEKCGSGQAWWLCMVSAYTHTPYGILVLLLCRVLHRTLCSQGRLSVQLCAACFFGPTPWSWLCGWGISQTGSCLCFSPPGLITWSCMRQQWFSWKFNIGQEERFLEGGLSF